MTDFDLRANVSFPETFTAIRGGGNKDDSRKKYKRKWSSLKALPYSNWLRFCTRNFYSMLIVSYMHILNYQCSVLTLHLALRRLAGGVVLIQKVWKGQTALEHKGPQSKMKKMGYIT